MAGILDLFTGSNPTLSSDVSKMGDLGTFSSNVGENATTSAANYYQKLLSGDPATIAQALAPQTKAVQDQAQQQKQTMGEFGTRSGGDTAAAANIDSSARGNIIDLISRAITGAAGNLQNIGSTNLNLAGTDIARQGQLAQQEYENSAGSLLGNLFGGLGGDALKAITGGLGKIPGLAAVI